jgi:hypothetical protein
MKIGITETENQTTKIQESRNIVKEIIKFGISEDQKIDVLYFLTLEIENRDLLEEITSILKNYRSNIKPEEEAEYDNIKSKKNKKLLGT